MPKARTTGAARLVSLCKSGRGWGANPGFARSLSIAFPKLVCGNMYQSQPASDGGERVAVQCWIPGANQGLDSRDGLGRQKNCPERGEKNGKVEAGAKAIERHAVYFVQVGDPRKSDARDAFCAIFFSVEI